MFTNSACFFFIITVTWCSDCDNVKTEPLGKHTTRQNIPVSQILNTTVHKPSLAVCSDIITNVWCGSVNIFFSSTTQCAIISNVT